MQMYKELFIIGDVHGEYDLLKQLLKCWDKEEQRLVFLGDLADRGPQSKKCWLKAKELVEKNDAVWIMGNHEDIFLQWLDDPSEKLDWYMRNGGEATINSLLYENILEEESVEAIASQIKYVYKDLVNFIRNLPLYYEFDEAICVHAGLNLKLKDWKDTSRRDMLWIREEFHHMENINHKPIVFGHTPVQSLHNTAATISPWFSGNKIGIDGGAVYHGALIGIVLTEKGIKQIHQIIHPNYKWE